MPSLYHALRPLLFRLDAEAAHEASLKLLEARAKLFGAPKAAEYPASLRTRAFGLDFPNPVGLAAGYDKDGRVPGALLGLGFGFTEIGTVTPLPQPGNPRPRLFRLTEDEAAINRFGFNSQGAADVLAVLKAGKPGAAAGVVGVNVGANKESTDRAGDYVLGYRRFADIADYVTVNISSPNTPGLRDLQGAGALGQLLGALRTARRELRDAGQKAPPLLLKIAPDLSEAELGAVVETAIAHEIDGLIVANTTLGRPDLRSAAAAEAGGLSGKPLFALSTAVLARAHRLAEGRLPLIGVGGISSGADAFAKIRAGADLVQLYTALVYQGPGLVRRIVGELAEIARREGLTRIADAVGADARALGRRGSE